MRSKLLEIANELMAAENMGDVHDAIQSICRHAGVKPLEGNFLDGWTDEDWRRVGTEPEECDA